MKIFLILLVVLLASSALAYFLWKKSTKAILEAEIERIKIPDDTFDEPQQKRS